MIEEKRVEDSRVETVHIIRPNHLNAAGRLFGGMLMQWLDEVKRHNIVHLEMRFRQLCFGMWQRQLGKI